MKTLLLFTFVLAGCSSLPPAMDKSRATEYMLEAANLSGRVVDAHTKPPTVYVIENPAAFFRVTCRDRHILCGFGTAGGIYLRYDQLVLINSGMLNPDEIDKAIIHELTHYLQHVQHDKRPCLDEEYEAFATDFKFQPDRHTMNLYERALESCAIGGGL